MSRTRRPSPLAVARGYFATEPRDLGRAAEGHLRVSVEGEILLYVEDEPIPFQLERGCTRCGSTDPKRWPAPDVREIAGAEVRVPRGHVCFWCRCYELQGTARPAPAPAPARPAPLVLGAPDLVSGGPTRPQR